MNLDLLRDGAPLIPGGATTALPRLFEIFTPLASDQAGVRLSGVRGLSELLATSGDIGKHVVPYLGEEARPVRAILFDKSPQTNWALGWHQDRTVAVKAQIDVEGFGPWTIKQGIVHVGPPMDLLGAMITIRVHLDPVPQDNAPLLIAPKSHMLGRIPEDQIAEIVARCGVFTCTAEAGDIWLYSTPILHASERAANPAHRRVLQVDYSADDLPDGLEWLGI